MESVVLVICYCFVVGIVVPTNHHSTPARTQPLPVLCVYQTSLPASAIPPNTSSNLSTTHPAPSIPPASTHSRAVACRGSNRRSPFVGVGRRTACMRASSTRDSLTAQSLIEPNSPHHEMVVLQRINVTTQRPPLRTGLLLQLPNPAVEQRFWSDEGVTR